MDLKNLEIRYPFNDWEGLRQLGQELSYDDGVEYRFKACMNQSSEKETPRTRDTWKKPLEITPLSETPFLNLQEVRRTVTVSYCKRVEEAFPKGALLINGETGLNNSLTSKFLRTVRQAEGFQSAELPDGTHRYPVADDSVRPFSAPMVTIAPVADFVMGSSVHQMFFGQEGTVTLPGRYSYLADGLEKMTDSDRQYLISRGRELMEKAEETYRQHCRETGSVDLSAYGQICGANEIVFERIRELAQENEYISGNKFILNRGTAGPNKLKIALKSLASEENRTAGDNAYEPNVEIIMFLALESGLAMDFFIKNDYICIEGGASQRGTAKPRLKILKKTESGTDEVTDSDVLRVLSFCTALKGDAKNEFNALVLSFLMQ